MSQAFLSSEEFDEQARQHYNAGEYELALDVLQEGLQYHPDSIELLVGLGYVRLAREEYAWAQRMFKTALAHDDGHEDAMVGLGETLLKFGRHAEALAWFEAVDALDLADLELGLAMGRALYREGFYHEARQRFTRLRHTFPDAAEVLAALAYSEHAVGDDLGARRHLRQALRLDPELHEARVYLAHLLFERGDFEGSLRELQLVPPAEHWDALSLWRVIDLRCTIEGMAEDDPRLQPWRERLGQLDGEPDCIDHLLAEVEAAFEAGLASASAQVPCVTHRVRLADGVVYSGSWAEIVAAMRLSAVEPCESAAAFMFQTAKRVRESTGHELCFDSEEAFLRSSAAIGLLEIEA
jgi:Flp pilus assembly protein TadD